MKVIAVVSTHTGTGKTTIVVNLAAGLMKKGYNVLIWNLNNDNLLHRWLSINKENALPGNDEAYTITSRMGIDVFICNSKEDLGKNEINFLKLSNNYDYLLLDVDSQPESLKLSAYLADVVIACTNLGPNEPENLAALDKKIQDISVKKLAINLVVPCKIKAREWENNTQQLFNIADWIGYEKIANLIPK